MKNVEIEFKIVEGINKEQIHEFVDQTIFGIARITKDLTNSCGYFPRLTGNLQSSSMAQDIRKESEAVYCLDVPGGADYAEYVWEFGENTNWTNPNTLPQWYYSTFEKYQLSIQQEAISNALRSVEK